MRTILLAALISSLAMCLGGFAPVPATAQDPAPAAPAAPAQPAGDPPAADPGNGDDNPPDLLDDTENADKLLTAEGKKAVDDGLAFIAGQQNNDGSFGRQGGSNYVIAITSLAGLALIAGGSLPGRGLYGDHVNRTIEYLISAQGNSGFFSVDGDGSRTHGHGFATLFLAQVLGMLNEEERQSRVRRAVANAVRIIEASQTPEGGWGYVPDDRTWDEASTTVTLVQGLRAARDAGVKVNKDCIDRAIRYVHKCAMRVDWTDSDGKTHVGYTFKYSLKYQNNRSTFPLTAAAVSTLQGSGVYDKSDVLQGGLDWINAFFHDTMKDQPNSNWYERFFYYSHLYAAQAMLHAPKPEYWTNYFPKVRDTLIKRRNSRNGTWPAPGGYGEVYATSIAVLILQMPYAYLPIFQK